MTKYNMDGISDAYFTSDDQYRNYTKYLNDQEEERQLRQAAIYENNKRMSTVSDSHYPNNENNARMRGISPAYNFGGSQYRKILGISDPAFSGGDEFVAYADYLKRIAEENEKPANDHSAVEANVRMKFDGGSAARTQVLDNVLSPFLPETILPGIKDFTGSQKSVMLLPQVVPAWKQYLDKNADGMDQRDSEGSVQTHGSTAGKQLQMNNANAASEKKDTHSTPAITILRQERDMLEKELDTLKKQAQQYIQKGQQYGNFDAMGYLENYHRQKELEQELKQMNEQIDAQWKDDILDAEANYPFYWTDNPNTENSKKARDIASAYKLIWYNIDASALNRLTKNSFPVIERILQGLSLGNEWYNTFDGNQARIMNLELSEEEKRFLNQLKTPEAFDYEGYIINQRKLSGVSYGWGTTPANGCGWIATYNALKMLGEEPNPFDIMRELENGALRNGTYGTDPLYIQRYFQQKGYDAKIYFTKEDIEREAPRSSANIWVYGWYYYDMNTKKDSIGAHFVAYGLKKGRRI